MKRIILVVLFAVGTLIPAAQPALADTGAAWNVTCNSVRWAADDPIVFPSRPGASHMHTFYGNRTTDSRTSTQSLLASGPSSCQREFQNADHSAYWIPALYRKKLGGGFEELHAAPADYTLTVYYRRGGAETGAKVDRPFPQGLRMIAGNKDAASPQAHVGFRCINTNDGSIQNKNSKDFPTCDANQTLLGSIIFPSCWDGKHLDMPDHTSHMAYATSTRYVCPADHPVKLPQVTFEAKWKNVNGPGNQYTLSSGNAYSFHGDFFAAWDQEIQAALVDQCANTSRHCTFQKLSQIHLDLAKVTAAETAAPAGLVKAATTTAPGPKPTAAANLPTTGPLTTWGSLAGLGAIASTYYVYRHRRRALALALRRR